MNLFLFTENISQGIFIIFFSPRCEKNHNRTPFSMIKIKKNLLEMNCDTSKETKSRRNFLFYIFCFLFITMNYLWPNFRNSQRAVFSCLFVCLFQQYINQSINQVKVKIIIVLNGRQFHDSYVRLFLFIILQMLSFKNT